MLHWFLNCLYFSAIPTGIKIAQFLIFLLTLHPTSAPILVMPSHNRLSHTPALLLCPPGVPQHRHILSVRLGASSSTEDRQDCPVPKAYSMDRHHIFDISNISCLGPDENQTLHVRRGLDLASVCYLVVGSDCENNNPPG